MNTLVANLGALVVLPSLVVTGTLYAVGHVLDRSFTGRPTDETWTAGAVGALGLFLFGHSLYSDFVPLFGDAAPWLYAVGGAYLTLGVCSLGHGRFRRRLRGRRRAAVGPWLAATLGAAVAVFAGSGGDPAALVGPVGASDSLEVVFTLLLSLPLALQFPLGYARRRPAGAPPFRHFAVVFVLYAFVLVGSVPLAERVRSPLSVVLVTVGCIGALLGAPAYVLGATLATSTEGR